MMFRKIKVYLKLKIYITHFNFFFKLFTMLEKMGIDSLIKKYIKKSIKFLDEYYFHPFKNNLKYILP